MMRLYLLNDKLQRIKPLSIYDSLTVNTFYQKEGNFTLKMPLMLFEYLRPQEKSDVFIENTEDKDNVYLVECIEKEVNEEKVKSLSVKGRTCVGLLDRRVALEAKNFEDKPSEAIVDVLLDENYINPENNLRKIGLIRYIVDEQPKLLETDYKLERGADGLSVIKDLSSVGGFGFCMGLSDDATQLNLKLYTGTDRTTNQNKVTPLVINLARKTALSIGYYKDITDVKTWAAIDKENDIPTTFPLDEQSGGSGLQRKETYLDLSSISQTINLSDGSQVVIEDKYYNNMIQNEAEARMGELKPTEYLDSDLTSIVTEKFGKSLFLGDKVTIIDDEIGFKSDEVITGATRVWSKKGYEASLQIGDNTI